MVWRITPHQDLLFTTRPEKGLINVPFIATVVNAISGDYEPRGNILDADCVFGLGFGLRRKPNGIFEPGLGNEALADFYLRQQHLLSVCGFMQHDLRRAVQDMVFDMQFLPPIKRFGALGVRSKTYDLLKQMQASILYEGYERPALVAARHHVPRIDAIAEKLKLKLIIPYGLPSAFDDQSAQCWTRRPASWACKEPLVLIDHARRGWI